MWPKHKDRHHAGFELGFRSGLEDLNAKHLEANRVPVLYETLKIGYTLPASHHTYTPDYELPNGIIVETKGRWLSADRKKMLAVLKQHPGLDIRMVFSRAKTPITGGSKTTCAMFADRHGIKWAEKLIPVAWCKEPGPRVKPRDVLARG